MPRWYLSSNLLAGASIAVGILSTSCRSSSPTLQDGGTGVEVPDDADPDAPVIDARPDGPRDGAIEPMFDAGVDAPPEPGIDAGVDAPPPRPLPDLYFIENKMRPTWTITMDNFRSTDCEVLEGCVMPGQRKLLRFDTVTANRGTADLVIGRTPPDGQSTDVFKWSECHRHHHFGDYTAYELLNDTGVVTTGRKQAFCLLDAEQIEPGRTSRGYNCANQGLSRGWADTYSRYLPCQWIDVTDVPSGTYTLRITVNPVHALEESNYDNNVFTHQVTF